MQLLTKEVLVGKTTVIIITGDGSDVSSRKIYDDAMKEPAKSYRRDPPTSAVCHKCKGMAIGHSEDWQI